MEEFQIEVGLAEDSTELQTQEEVFTMGVGVAEEEVFQRVVGEAEEEEEEVHQMDVFQAVEVCVSDSVHQVEEFQAGVDEVAVSVHTTVEVFQRVVEEVDVFQMGVGVA